MRKFEIPKSKTSSFSEVGKDNIGLKTIKILKKKRLNFMFLNLNKSQHSRKDYLLKINKFLKKISNIIQKIR